MYPYTHLFVGVSRKQYKKPFIVFIPGALGSRIKGKGEFTFNLYPFTHFE